MTIGVAGQERQMLLENKNAVIYGGGGAIGSAVARAFAREGARVFLAGRTLARLDAIAKDIRATGGEADTAKVDAPFTPAPANPCRPSQTPRADAW